MTELLSQTEKLLEFFFKKMTKFKQNYSVTVRKCQDLGLSL